VVVEDIESEGGDDRRRPTTTLEGWRRFVGEDPFTIELLPENTWLDLSEDENDRYKEVRVNYHSELIIVETPTIREVLHQGRLLTLVNRREISARRGLIVSGAWATGKSTAIKQFGLAHELHVRRRYPGEDRIPVVYISAPPGGSPRKLATRFAHFLGLPLKTRHNEMDIADAVCEILTDARCDLVLVDEIHNINNATTSGKDISDHLKYFAEHIPATFVYAGINVEREGLFTGVRGKQIAARCVMQHTGTFPYRSEWRSMVASMEQALRLHRHEPGTLAAQAKYLYQRTGGSISSLSHLIRAAAISAIADGSEQITKPLLKSITVDHNTQTDAPSSKEDAAEQDQAE
jgi:Bacterial TniB protein